MSYTVPPINSIPFAFGDETPTDTTVDGILSTGQLASITIEAVAKNIVGGVLT